MSNNKYFAFAIDYCESACGCSYARYHHIYDSTGNKYKEFDTRAEASQAAIAHMIKKSADNWNVI
jgi:hypothetical protein